VRRGPQDPTDDELVAGIQNGPDDPLAEHNAPPSQIEELFLLLVIVGIAPSVPGFRSPAALLWRVPCADRSPQPLITRRDRGQCAKANG
jgi:hypothetical protein